MKSPKNPQQQKQKPAPVSADLKLSATNFTPSADEVARRAYFSYLNEGARPGREVQHWLEAEAQLQVERALTREHGFHNHSPIKASH
jgi:hypothetical protein